MLQGTVNHNIGYVKHRDESADYEVQGHMDFLCYSSVFLGLIKANFVVMLLHDYH